jgi:hypothetical protein
MFKCSSKRRVLQGKSAGARRCYGAAGAASDGPRHEISGIQGVGRRPAGPPAGRVGVEGDWAWVRSLRPAEFVGQPLAAGPCAYLTSATLKNIFFQSLVGISVGNCSLKDLCRPGTFFFFL